MNLDENGQVFKHLPMRSLFVVIAKLYFPFVDFFVVDVACIAPFRESESAGEKKRASIRSVKDFRADCNARIRLDIRGREEPNDIHRLHHRTKRLEHLPSVSETCE